MARWTKYLKNLLPRTGRVIRENGEAFNQADGEFWREKSDLAIQSLFGMTYTVSYRLVLAADETRDFVLEVADGVRVRVHSRGQTVINGGLDWEVRSGADPGYMAEETVLGKNTDGEVGGVSQSQFILTTAAGTTGSTFLYEGSVVSPGAGSQRSTSQITDADAVSTFIKGNRPVLRFTNRSSSGSVEFIVTLVFVEEPE